MDPFTRLKPTGLLMGIVLMVVGIIFLVVPDRVAEFLAIFIGAIIAVFGLFRIIFIAFNWNAAVNRAVILTVGILLSVTGIFMLTNPKFTISVIGTIIGIFAVLMAFERFTTAWRVHEEINALPIILSGLIHLAFGIGMIYAAVVVFSIIIVLIGIYLLIAGIMIALSTIFFQAL